MSEGGFTGSIAIAVGTLVLIPMLAAAGVIAGVSSLTGTVAAASPTPTGPPASPVSAGGGGADPTAAMAAVLAYAVAQLGDPYLYGGTNPAGFDCSGLTQAAYAAAGIAIARTSEQQWQTGIPLSSSQLRAGDLVFFNPGEDVPGLPGHVGIYLGGGLMIDAPHTGTVVRVEPVPEFGVYQGARRYPG